MEKFLKGWNDFVEIHEKENHSQQKTKINEQKIDEARPYLSFYGKKDGIFNFLSKEDGIFKPINFAKKYPDFGQFLDETKNKKISAEWIEAGSAGDLTKMLSILPAQIRHKMSQVVHNMKDKWNKNIPSLSKIPIPGFKLMFSKYFTNQRKSPIELWTRYRELLKEPKSIKRSDIKGKNEELQGLQFILEYEYEMWKESKNNEQNN